MLSKLDEQNEIAASLCEHIRNKVFFSYAEDVEDYKQEVAIKLRALKNQAKKEEVIAFLNQLIQECSSVTGDRYEVEDAYLNTLDSLLMEFFEGLDGDSLLVDELAVQDIFDKSSEQNQTLTDCAKELNNLQDIPVIFENACFFNSRGSCFAA